MVNSKGGGGGGNGALGPGMKGILAASIALNLVLAVLVFRARSAAPPNASTAGGASPALETLATETGTKGETNGRPAFRWSDIESKDYKQYAAKLREIGCPEAVVADIIRADLNGSYGEKMAAVWRPEAQAYWQKPKRQRPGPDELQKLDALTKEKEQGLKEVLGTAQEEQAWADAILFQIQGTEQQLLFLPEEKRAAAARALREAGVAQKETKALETGGSAADLFQEKLKVLSQVLSPDEVEEFRLRYSPAAESLRLEVQYFDCSEAEFKQLLDSREKEHRQYSNLLDRREATAEVTKLFGEERGREFEKVSDLFYINTRRVAEDNGLAPEVASQVYDVVRAARANMEKLLADPSFSAQTKMQSARNLAMETEKELARLMGESAARPIVRDLRNVLGTLDRRARQ